MWCNETGGHFIPADPNLTGTLVPMTEEQAAHEVTSRARAAREAQRALRRATTAEKNAALEAIATALTQNSTAIIEANAQDLENGRQNGLSEVLQDRLLLTEERIGGIANALRQLIALPDPVGEVVRGQSLPNGLTVRQTRVPMGVVGMIYEARPNVTVDAAGLALKSGNAALLRGGSAAENSNRVIVQTIRDALTSVNLPADLVASIDDLGRAGAVALMRARGDVDVLIPRGGSGLIQTVVRESQVPVIETGVGNCHVYIDASADPAKAEAIALNAKTHRPGVCNAAETILLHSDIADSIGSTIIQSLDAAGVAIHGCPKTEEVAGAAGVVVKQATEEDWSAEYLALEVAIRAVDSLDAAIDHIRQYSSGHTEAIVTGDLASARTFVAECDSAAVMVNASTRFTDGGELGLGAEIGISTQKLHARGPMGLAELTTTTWVVEGDGHVR